MKITITDKITPALRRLSEKGKDMTPAMKKVGAYMVESTVKDRFKQQQTPSGVKWGEWSPKYKKYREAMGKKGNKLLVDTGELIKSIGYIVGNTFCVFGTGKDYALKQQFGSSEEFSLTDKKGKKYTFKGNKARRFIGISDWNVVQIREIIAKFFIRRG